MAATIGKAAAWLGLVRDEEDERYGDDVEQFSEPIYGYERSEEDRDTHQRRPAQQDHYRDAADVELAFPIRSRPTRPHHHRPSAGLQRGSTIGEHFMTACP